MNRNAFTLMELLVVIALIAILTAVAVPTFKKYSESSKGQRCCANILLIENAKDAFIIDHPGRNITANDLVAYLKYGMPSCPSGGSYQQVTNRYARITCTAKPQNQPINGQHDYGQP